ncbi:MAG: TRAP transporter large permease subunit, partial [Anaerotignaceae bacterium]
EISLRLGTIDTIMGVFIAKFGNRPRVLRVCILFSLTLAGSLLGDAIAASAVIGMLTIGILVSMNIENEKISAIIVMGACVGSIMPPMTQSLALAATLANADPDAVINIGFITIPFVFVVVCIYTCVFLIKKENVPGANPEIKIKHMDKKPSEILKHNWKSLIPVSILIVIILLRTLKIPYLTIDIGPAILKNISLYTYADGTKLSFYQFISNVSILKGFSNGIVLSIICAIGCSFVFPTVSKNAGSIFSEAFGKVKNTIFLQVCCAFMLGSFYAAGSIDTVSEFAAHLDSNILIFGGVVGIMALGMLTGSQSTAQNVVFSFFGPALVATGITATNAAVAGAHLASAGQGLPPADLTTFVVVGIVSAQFGKKVDPVKSMIYSAPMCICFFIIGMMFLYI